LKQLCCRKDGSTEPIKLAIEMRAAFPGTVPDIETLEQFEVALNSSVPSDMCAILCLCPEKNTPVQLLLDIIHTHEKIVIDGTICDNTMYIPPDVFLRMRKEKNLDILYRRIKEELISRKKISDKIAENQRILVQSEQRYRALFNHIHSGVAIYQAYNDGNDFIIMDFNAAAEQIEKIHREQVIGKNALEAFPGIKEFGLFDVLQKVWRTGEPEYHPASFYRDNRIEGWRENYVYKLPSGEVVAVYDDITKQKQTEKQLVSSYENPQKMFVEIIQAMAKLVESRDPYTADHQKRTAALSRRIAKMLGMKEEDVHWIYLAALIHDVGKISVPSEILTKPGKLTPVEFSLVQTHAAVGFEILKKISFPWPVAPMILQHHERMNGSGYPSRLTGNNIQATARILAVADVVEAMNSHRPYRAALGIEKALEEISANSGTLYDPDVVAACVRIFREGKYDWTD